MGKSRHGTGKGNRGLMRAAIGCALLLCSTGLWAQSPPSQSTSKDGINLTVSQLASTIPEVLEFKLVAVNTTKADVSLAGNVIILDKQQKELTTGPYFVELKAGATKEDVCYAIVEKPDLVGSWKVIIDDVYDFILELSPTESTPPVTESTPQASPGPGTTTRPATTNPAILGRWLTQGGTPGWGVEFKADGNAHFTEILGPEARLPREMTYQYTTDKDKVTLVITVKVSPVPAVYTLKDGKLVADPPETLVLEKVK
jgi:hypothetical protein